MNWLQRNLKKIEAIPLKKDQLVVFYTKGLRTMEQLQLVKERLKALLDDFKINFLIVPSETIEKIDVIEKEDMKPDGTVIPHYSILL